MDSYIGEYCKEHGMTYSAARSSAGELFETCCRIAVSSRCITLPLVSLEYNGPSSRTSMKGGKGMAMSERPNVPNRIDYLKTELGVGIRYITNSYIQQLPGAQIWFPN
jgi:hypothetical protein